MTDEYKVSYPSIEAAMKTATVEAKKGVITRVSKDGRIDDNDFVGCKHWSQVEHMAINGWDEQTDRAIQAAGEAIETVEKMIDMPAFAANWDVSGCEVDVARYLAGEPENMIDYELIKAPRNGRVITLCASNAISWAVSTEAINRRGYIVTALALSLTKLGYAVELWSDISVREDGNTARMRVLVKGPNDELDPSRIMYAYAHPSMLRAIGFGLMHALPDDWPRRIGAGLFYGIPTNPAEDLPEGTIYLPCLKSSEDVPDADEGLLNYIKELGIVD